MPPVFGILPQLKGRSSAVIKKPSSNLTGQSRAISSNPSMEVFNSLVEMPAPWRQLNELYLEFPDDKAFTKHLYNMSILYS